MSKKSAKNKLIHKKRSIKKGRYKVKRREKLSAKQKSEIEDLINAPRSTHYKRERFAYDEYHDLEYQRLTISEGLKKTLIEQSINEYHFTDWVRCVPYQYSDDPLSSRGSVCSIGGRFNIGEDIQDGQFTAFNALYIAEDQITALLEKFGVTKSADLEKTMEACFSKKVNTTTIHVKGVLHNVLDLDSKSALNGFVKLISGIKKSSEIHNRAKALGLESGGMINTVKGLRESLYDPEWRFNPQIYDLPANPQIFGQYAYRAGIEAILYTSVKGGKKCMAIYPKNLSEKSYIEISGPFPKTIKISKLDSTNYRETL